MNKKIYVCGGYVRDYIISKIHNIPFKPNDKDFVAVGYTIDEMIDLGYKQVGKEFPVFLDQNGNEIALARIERKTGNKHTDFEFDFNPNVSLKEDALRRNHTINSLYLDEETGEIIDYVNGIKDIKNKILRHTSKYYVQDPLRVLITARQSAQLGFEIASETMELMKQMVKDGMLNHLTAERVWKETEKALSEGYDSRKFFETLNECGALEVLFPELYALVNTPEIEQWHPSGNSFKHTMIALSKVKNYHSMIKFAIVCHDLGKGTTPKDILPHHYGHENRGGELIDILCERLRVPNDYKKFAKIFCKNHMKLYKLSNMKASKKYLLIKELSDRFENKPWLTAFIKCFMADYFGENKEYSLEDYETFADIVEEMYDIYNTMANVRLDDLPEKTQQKLTKLSGEKFGEAYTQAMIDYMIHHLS